MKKVVEWRGHGARLAGLLLCLWLGGLCRPEKTEGAPAGSSPKRVKDLGPAPKTLVVYWAVSLDGQRLAYKTTHGPKATMYCDGQEGPAYDDVGWPFFSTDGKHVAYCAKRRDEKFKDHWCVVYDGKEGTFYDEIKWSIVQFPSPFSFSPDSRHLACVARREDRDGKPKWFVLYDGKEGRAYEDVQQLLFSADSKHFVYSARRKDEDGKDRWYMVWNGREGLPYDLIEWGLPGLKPMFSSDGNHVLYWGRRLDKEGSFNWFLVLDGVESGPYASVQVLSEREEDQGKIRYLTLDGTKASLIEIDWPKEKD